MKKNKIELTPQEGNDLVRYIAHLAATYGGAGSSTPLNPYRQEELQDKLLQEFQGQIRRFNPEIVPDFVPFSKAMLKRSAKRLATRLFKKQIDDHDGVLGYESLDALIDEDEENGTTLCDRIEVEDESVYRREQIQMVREVIKHLPSEMAQLLYVFMDVDQEKKHTAYLLNISRPTLDKRLGEAFAAFKEVWAGLYGDEGICR